MIDGNISMEEDTELRDLVVQTLENNGVLAKIRAELRASVFLALEEQDSVMNPEPLLNKTVKQYLSNSEGKLLFSLVREFLEYFGLDYTISVYDPETYFGKEYNYVGRNKLCEELGIDSTEPLLGEILKNSINGAFNSSQKSKNSNRHDETDETSTHFANATFEVSVPKIIHTESVSSSNDNDSSEKLDTTSEQSPKVPINVTITDKKCKDPPADSDIRTDTSDKCQSSLRESTTDTEGIEDLPSINQKANSIFGDLPPLNGKKANINDLKELMNISLAADGIDHYEEDFVSSASGSANEQSPSKEPDKLDSPLKSRTKKEEKTPSARTEDLSEEIEEVDEILSSTSCLEDTNTDKNISNFTTGITADYT
nr:PREDICTED: FGFR1 oncogene partner-like isoform X3 [Linepithema humile]